MGIQLDTRKTTPTLALDKSSDAAVSGSVPSFVLPEAFFFSQTHMDE
jgi:hypothetical protein